MSEVEIIKMSPLTLLMKKQRWKAYNLNQVHHPQTVADPGLEPKPLRDTLQARVMRKKTHLENAHHLIDLWHSPPENFYSDVCLVR